MEKKCCACNVNCELLHTTCDDYYCNHCFHKLFRTNVIASCCFCEKKLKLSDFSKITATLPELSQIEIQEKLLKM